MNTSVSKAISYLLRHGAQRESVPIEPDGYVTVDNLIKWLKSKSYDCDPETIVNIVTNDKKTEISVKV